MRTDKQDEYGIDYTALTDSELGLLSRHAQEAVIRCRAFNELDRRHPQAAAQATDCLTALIELADRFGEICLFQAVSDYADGRADHAWDNAEQGAKAWRSVAEAYSRAARHAYQCLKKFEVAQCVQ